MTDNLIFGSLYKTLNKYTAHHEKFAVPQLPNPEFEVPAPPKEDKDDEKASLKSAEIHETRHYAAFQTNRDSPNPRICIWDYMQKNELIEFLQISSTKQIRETIGKPIHS